MPADRAEALDGDAAAQRTFDALSCSPRRRHVLAIDDAKTPKTRQRRIAKAVAMLGEGQKERARRAAAG